ncbi:hypothetical protein [Planomonospora sp. ID82291]|uniref:hypothetical protein n=1 Tax=Planomonospora sp. ID82291 TaxID=2738136 RepID=UPI0018C3E29A|nr:hypothetical protein [Planomonospora sp. ID82291]MBG0814110.1 hypothetical protein [Planomonospora sp. ID82291]
MSGEQSAFTETFSRYRRLLQEGAWLRVASCWTVVLPRDHRLITDPEAGVLVSGGTPHEVFAPVHPRDTADDGAMPEKERAAFHSEISNTVVDVDVTIDPDPARVAQLTGGEQPGAYGPRSPERTGAELFGDARTARHSGSLTPGGVVGARNPLHRSCMYRVIRSFYSAVSERSMNGTAQGETRTAAGVQPVAGDPGG